MVGTFYRLALFPDERDALAEAQRAIAAFGSTPPPEQDKQK
jgi:hypothetical protein